ncbi:hypothetical protein [Halocatena halophila]|uniref:hypothetical protein n=1 Tax=Halocatena halophila TaxID=2814576 RepID=UPI002ED5C24C
MPREHNESGDFIETVSHEDVIEVFDDYRSPCITSGDVKKSLGCTPETARRKLKELHNEGIVEKRKTAGRIIWWLAEENN